MPADIGIFVTKNMQRSENDTNDIVVHLLNADGTNATVVGWTAVLSVGVDNDLPTSPAATFTGVGVTAGLIPIDMSTFAVVKGSYKYDVRVTDTVTIDTPSRVYFKGKFKVTPRIN